ncbi:radical SAM family heme chaperone HemW [Brackiella oedipodis]|uniref:radical SAM family heme chaperone HemW n=1 Tax=Brackiella oedipodis TaxID=124225 RepID=UPI00048CAA59|nr:radical SAM family heme chaperone HemW [Brackiella oedipodis]
MDSIIPIVTETFRKVSAQQSQIAFPGNLPLLSVYLHVPWCVRKCPYCDFNSHEAPSQIPEQDYIEAIQAELLQYLPLIWGRRIYSVFIGGGTPSLLSAQAMDKLLSLLRNLLNLPAHTEITMEANPGTAEAQRFADYAQSGVNRLSIGVQSFNDQSLQALGRIHSAHQAKQAIEWAQKSFSRINLDLMYGVPHQGLDEWRQDLSTAISFGTEHLSLYNLTLEPNTVFAKYPPRDLADEDVTDDMLALTEQMTGANGFEHYEISAYARKDAECKHNLNYWQFGDYLGLGPGAHGKISFPNKIVRTANVRSPSSWLQKTTLGDGTQRATWHELSPSEIPFEFMLNVLRLKQGVGASLFVERTGLSPLVLRPGIKQAVQKGLMLDDATRFACTDLGWRFLNEVQMLFLETH